MPDTQTDFGISSALYKAYLVAGGVPSVRAAVAFQQVASEARRIFTVERECSACGKKVGPAIAAICASCLTKKTGEDRLVALVASELFRNTDGKMNDNAR